MHSWHAVLRTRASDLRTCAARQQQPLHSDSTCHATPLPKNLHPDAELPKPRRPITFRGTTGLFLREGQDLSIDCAFQPLDLVSRAGPFRLPPRATLRMTRCYANNYRDAAAAADTPAGPEAGEDLVGGTGRDGGTLHVHNSTLRWFDEVQTATREGLLSALRVLWCPALGFGVTRCAAPRVRAGARVLWGGRWPQGAMVRCALAEEGTWGPLLL